MCPSTFLFYTGLIDIKYQFVLPLFYSHEFVIIIIIACKERIFFMYSNVKDFKPSTRSVNICLDKKEELHTWQQQYITIIALTRSYIVKNCSYSPPDACHSILLNK